MPAHDQTCSIFRAKEENFCMFLGRMKPRKTKYNLNANQFTCSTKWANDEDNNEKRRNSQRAKYHSVNQWNKAFEIQFVYNQTTTKLEM